VVVFGGLTAWLASTKHRDGCSWFFLGALIGPLALIAVGLAPAAQKTPGSSPTASSSLSSPLGASLPNGGEVQGGPTKTCPDCAEVVKAEARICRFCRYVFPEAPAPDESIAREGPVKLGRWSVAATDLIFPVGTEVEIREEQGRLVVASHAFRRPLVAPHALATNDAKWLRIEADKRSLLLAPLEGQSPAEAALEVNAGPRGGTA